jgi:hypothetical protein
VVNPPPGNGCMADPSVCGYPDVETTGLSNPSALTTVNGSVTLSTAGQVYQDKLVNGSITVTAPDVTIRNVKVVSGGWAVRCRTQDGGCQNLTINDTEINLNGDIDGYGILDANYNAHRLFIHNGSDCAYVQKNAQMHDSLCAVGPDSNNDGWPDSTGFCSGPEHFDGLTSDGGSNEVYDHNTIRNPCTQTSAILISTNTSPISNVTITNNLMTGGGYTLYCAASNPGVGGFETVTGNRIAKTYRPTSGYYGPTAYCSSSGVTTWSGNVWDEDGSPLPR